MTSLLHFFPRSPEEEEEEPSIQSLDIEKHRTHSLTQAMKKRGRRRTGARRTKTTKMKRRFLAGISSTMKETKNTKKTKKKKNKTSDLVALHERRQPPLRRSDSRLYPKIRL